MNFKSILCALLCTPILLFAQSDNKKNYSLEDCIQLALQNNYDLKSTNLLAETATIAFKQNGNALLPAINGSYNLGLTRGRSIDPFTNDFVNEELKFSSARLALDAVVFNGFRLINSWKQARLNLRASEMEVEAARQNLTLEVTLGFLQVLNNRDLVTLTTSQLSTTQGQLDRLQSLFESESGNPAEYRDLQGQITNDQASLVNARNALRTSEINLNLLINNTEEITADTIDILLDFQLYQTTLDEVITDALDNLPTLKARNLRLEAAEKGVSVAKAQYVPQVSFFANLGTNYSSAARLFTPTGTSIEDTGSFVTLNNEAIAVLAERTNFSTEEISFADQFDNNVNSSLGLAVSVPVFNGFRAKNNVALEKIKKEEAEIALARTQLELERTIEQSYNAMSTAYERYGILEKQVAAYEESFRINEIRFTTGLTTSIDYIVSKNNLDNARINLSNVRYEYALRVKVLEYYRGV
ncbi:MAG: outer membrane protein [Flavobacteriales bacterium]|jgi:outer membrane protein